MSSIRSTIKQERIAAYEDVLAIFPSATDMARELSIDKRTSICQWRRRGVPIEYIMVLDMLGLVCKEVLIPSVRNWDSYLSKYEHVIQNKLRKMLLVDSLKKTTISTLQTVLSPLVDEMVDRRMKDTGALSESEKDTPELEKPESDSSLGEDDLM